MLEIACNRCDRRGRLHTERLLAEHGPGLPMLALRRIVAADCPRMQADKIHDICGVHFPGLLTALRITAPASKTTPRADYRLAFGKQEGFAHLLKGAARFVVEIHDGDIRPLSKAVIPSDFVDDKACSVVAFCVQAALSQLNSANHAIIVFTVRLAALNPLLAVRSENRQRFVDDAGFNWQLSRCIGGADRGRPPRVSVEGHFIARIFVGKRNS